MHLNSALKKTLKAKSIFEKYLKTGVQLRHEVAVFIQHGSLIFSGEKTSLSFSNSSQVKRYSHDLLNGVNAKDFDHMMNNQVFLDMIESLEQKGMLKPNIEASHTHPAYQQWCSHQTQSDANIGDFSQTKILFLGAGTITSIILQQLSSLNLGSAIIIDDSEVKEEDLGTL